MISSDELIFYVDTQKQISNFTYTLLSRMEHLSYNNLKTVIINK